MDSIAATYAAEARERQAGMERYHRQLAEYEAAKRLSPEDREARNRQIMGDAIPGYWHRANQIEGMVREQGRRQRAGALPISGGPYGSGATASSRSAAKAPAKAAKEPSARQTPPASREDRSLVDAWIADVDARFERKMRGASHSRRR
jgi:hypothetical protein